MIDIHDQYTYEIQHEIVLLKTGEANHAILSQLSIIFEIPDDNERVHKSWKDDSDNYRIRGWAILARMNSCDSGNWQEVCCVEQSTYKYELKQLERSLIANCTPWHHLRFLTAIGRNYRTERWRVSLFGHHLTIQEFMRGVEAFMYASSGTGWENKSCVIYNRGERLVLIVLLLALVFVCFTAGSTSFRVPKREKN